MFLHLIKCESSNEVEIRNLFLMKNKSMETFYAFAHSLCTCFSPDQLHLVLYQGVRKAYCSKEYGQSGGMQ